MPTQLITIHPDGSLTSLDFKRKGLDLRQLGNATIKRISEVLFEDERQQWYVMLKSDNPVYNGSTLNLMLLAESGAKLNESTYYIGGPGNQLFFPDYDDAVTAEVAIIQGLRAKGLWL